LLIDKEWKLSQYHLLGHSFGGILAYEYLVQVQQSQNGNNNGNGNNGCQSLLLASAPTSAALIEQESKRLYQELQNNNNQNHNGDNDDDDPAATRQVISEAFRQTHECRLAQTPLALIDALAQAGPTSWRGIPAIADYQAIEKLQQHEHVMPTLVMRGEYDFCTPACVEGWKDLIEGDPSPQERTLKNCSHYGMLEDEQQYGKVITEFLQEQEDAANNN
jgi:pimeloyl-ACP methyl ester carboxylesterase